MCRLAALQVLQPAIELAEDGFPVSPITARLWAGHREQLLQGGGHAFLNKDKTTPKYGQLFRNPDLAETFKTLAEQGAQAGKLSCHCSCHVQANVQLAVTGRRVPCCTDKSGPRLRAEFWAKGLSGQGCQL